MKLTLRSLFAYLNNLLPEEAVQELEQKIEQNTSIAELVQRIRMCCERRQLGAPQLDNRGVGLDANTVAEYLEDLLPPERVPDFEKVCLESDMHLAETACCHHVLALVVKAVPAECPPALHEKIYRLGAPDTTRKPPGAGKAGKTDKARTAKLPPKNW